MLNAIVKVLAVRNREPFFMQILYFQLIFLSQNSTRQLLGVELV